MKNVRLRPLYSPGITSGPSTCTPNCLLLRGFFGSGRVLEVAARVERLVLPEVEDRLPCRLLVPLLVTTLT